METADNPLRVTSTLTEEIQRDRILIKEKLLRHSRRQRQRRHPLDGDDSVDDAYETMLLRSAQHHQEQHSINNDSDIMSEEGDEESLEAMKHALTNHPQSWWAMRKHLQSIRGGAAGGSGGDGEMKDGSIDSSVRRGSGNSMIRPRTNSNLIGHPVLLVDPSTIGYESSSYRNHNSGVNNNSSNSKYSTSIMYVSRDTFIQRKILHMLYLLVSLCFIFGGVFVLEQRKLSHYALVESPMSLSAYLAGEELVSKGSMTDVESAGIGNGGGDNVADNNLETVGDEGLMICGKVPAGAVGSLPPEASTAGSHRFDTLKAIFVNCGVTPAVVLNNPASAQFRALQWMAYEDDLQYKPVSERWIKKLIQRYTLVTFYYATNGEGWKNQLYFLSNRDECNWNRVYERYFSGAGYCNKEGFVTALALWGNSLDGGECDPLSLSQSNEASMLKLLKCSSLDLPMHSIAT